MQKDQTAPAYSRTTLLVLWLIIVAAGYALIERWGAAHIDHTEIRLQTRLQQQAAQKAASIEDWLTARTDIIHTMANNSSLKLYASQLNSNGAVEPSQAERIFLRNYLISMAARTFSSGGNDALAQINANVEPVANGGLGLFDTNLTSIVNTQGMSALSALPAEIRTAITSNRSLTSGPHVLKNLSAPVMVFSAPVYGIQADELSDGQLGYVVGIAPLDSDFFARLENVIAHYDTEEAVLIQPKGNGIRYVSSWNDSTSSMLSFDNASALASGRLADDPSALVASPDYDGTSVYATAHRVENTDWLLVNKVDQKEALHDIHQHITSIRTGYILGALTLSFAMVALWRHASAVRSKEMADHYRTMAHTIEKQEQLLDLITDSTPAGISITNWDHEYCYANKAAADQVGMERSDLIGRNMVGILGKDAAEQQIKANRAASAENALQTYVSEEKDAERITRSVKRQHIPLEAIPLPGTEDRIPGVLIIEEDITDVARAQAAQRATLRHLIQSLVDMVDERDPHAAHHSASVAHIARAIAEEMGLDETEINTAETAGQLMNIGKLSVSEEVLISDKLSSDQVGTIRNALQSSVDYLEKIEFDGPVVETIRQSQERLDGSGPLGVSGNKIQLSARITAVANSFVAMTSDRAYRAGLDIDDALKELMQSIDTLYDRKVVAALVSYMDNRNGRGIWLKTLGDQ